VFRVILVTAPAAEAEPLARKLVTERLAACANLVPGVRSLYWWQGRLEDSQETLIVLKAPPRNVARLKRRVKELHSYQVPEVVVLPVRESLKAYAAWVRKEARPARRRGKRS
jgi:periplasmic divalent cation tolerance protein